MSESDQLGESGHCAKTIRRIEQAMERYAPLGYDPATDDMTIPFAMQLVEKDAEIASLRADPWKRGAESMRQAILQNLPGGQLCDPQLVADMIRAIALPGT